MQGTKSIALALVSSAPHLFKNFAAAWLLGGQWGSSASFLLQYHNGAIITFYRTIRSYNFNILGVHSSHYWQGPQQHSCWISKVNKLSNEYFSFQHLWPLHKFVTEDLTFLVWHKPEEIPSPGLRVDHDHSNWTINGHHHITCWQEACLC